jgi:hypothetical protein
LGWTPGVGLEQSVEQTLDFFLREAVRTGEVVIDDDRAEVLDLPASAEAAQPVTRIVSITSNRAGRPVRRVTS